MKKLIGFVILLIAAAGGWWYWVKSTPPEKPVVSKVTISQGDVVEAVQSTGALEPKRRYDIGSQVSGVVQKIHVDYNSIVKKGDLMAEIDPSLLQVQVDIQRANVERSKSDIASQEVQLEDQKKQFEKTKTLFEKGLQNQQAFESAELAIKTREASIASSHKSLVSVEAQLNSALLNVSYTKIVAPAAGVVVERRVDVGQTVQASMTSPSFFIMNEPLDNLKLTANVDESEIGKIRSGMEVRFKVESYGPQQFYGTVEAVRLNASVNNNVVTYPVWIAVPNSELKLRPFMTASLSIILSTATDVIRVPMAATRFRPNNETYLALGLTPPQAGGRVNAPGTTGPETNGAPGGRDGRGQNAQPGATAPAGQNAQAGQAPGARTQQNAADQPGARGGNRTPGQGGQTAGAGGQGRTPGRGAGMNLTPEQQQAMRERFARGGGGAAGGRGGQPGGGRGGAGGRGGNAGQGRGGNAGQRGGQPATLAPELAAKNAEKIDELWAKIVARETPASVWKWDGKELKEVKIRLGVSDGTFSELRSGELNVGDEVVSSVTLPAALRPTNTQNPLMGQPNRQQPGMGGMGGGNPGGGGAAGGGRGGGGGGRGGN